ncbi:MAG: hypothetical protein RI894_2025 [Bacteroidota bacterium]|jgi:hypothetical protein
MQTYLTQLLADLKAAETGERPTKPDYKILYPEHPAADPQYKGRLDYIIEWEMGIVYKPAALFGIAAEAFPPAEKLAADQIESLIDAILSLWYSYNITVNFPENADSTVLYNWLLNKWATGGENGGFPLMDEDGHYGMETCHYGTENCIWGEACTCKDLEDDWDDMPEQTPEEKEPEEKEDYEKGLKHHPNGAISWINPELLDENGNFDPAKLKGRSPDSDLPF